MIDAALQARLLRLHPVLAELPAAERQAVLDTETLHMQAPAGTLLFDKGSACPGFPLLLTGGVRVARGSPGGRTLELYRVTLGELCVVSTACLFGQGALSAHGQTTEATELLLLSPAGSSAGASRPCSAAMSSACWPTAWPT